MPYLFDRLFTDNFDLFKFKINNECYLREESIKKFIKSDNILDKRNYILSMFEEYFIYAKTTIDFFYPSIILVNHFNTPYLELYLKSIYSLNPDLKFLSTNHLIQKLINFNKLNPNYGQPFVTKKRDNENNIHLIYRYNTTINIESSNIIDNLLQNNNENYQENEEELEELEEDEQAEEDLQDEGEDEYDEGEEEHQDNEDIEHQEEDNDDLEESYQYLPIIEFNIEELYGNTINN